MFARSILVVAGLFLLSLCTVAGRAQGGASAPAVPEMTTPKGALAFFSEAIRQADVAKIKSCLHTTNALEQRMADSTSEVAASLSRLRLAAIEKYGEAGGVTFQGGVPTEEDIQRIRGAEEKIEKDQAVVTVAGGNPAGPARMRMVKVGGQWKISVAHMVAGQSAAVVDDQLKKAKTTLRVVNETIDEIKAGKHATDKAASEALKSKMKAAFPAPPPAPAPAKP